MKKFSKVLIFVLCCFGCCATLFFTSKINAMTSRYRFSYIPISDILVDNIGSENNIESSVSVVFGFTWGLLGDNYPTIASNELFGNITKIELIRDNNNLYLIYYEENENRNVIVWRGNANAYNFNLVNNDSELGVLGVWTDLKYNDLYLDLDILEDNIYFVADNNTEYFDNINWFISSVVPYSSYNTFNTKYEKTLSVDFNSLIFLYENYGKNIYYLDFIYNNLNYNQLSIHKGIGGYIYFNFSYYLNGDLIRSYNATIYNPTTPNNNINIELYILTDTFTLNENNK